MNFNNPNSQLPFSQENMLASAAIMSLVIAYQKLLENRQQTADNNVNRANDEQAQYILLELSGNFNEQKQMLRAILFELRRLNYNLERSL